VLVCLFEGPALLLAAGAPPRPASPPPGPRRNWWWKGSGWVGSNRSSGGVAPSTALSPRLTD
jgi:hypothetical protein